MIRKKKDPRETLISVVIPVFNISNELTNCLDSLFCQTMSKDLYEVVIVDDSSTDNTFDIALRYSENETRVRCYRLRKNCGPGIARNKGIQEAKGRFILFLDGDDFLPKYALKELGEIIFKKQADVITFNWAYFNGAENSKNLEPQRRDLKRFPDKKVELIRRFLSMNFDGSVIYTMTSKKIFDDNSITFPEGLHEDISVIFKIYYYAKNLYVENKVMYIKRKRIGSIVNTISKEHIDGFFSSWVVIKKFISDQKGIIFMDKLMQFYMKGFTGLVAIALLKNIAINDSDPQIKNEIYSIIYESIKLYFLSDIKTYSLPKQTKYDYLANCFYNSFVKNEGDHEFAANYFESKAISLNLI